ncbi:MAG: hypothetical protein M8364_11605 [Methylobacter sp.]|jgi:hypothetical protein|uniref:hypothetical protein n=1 Tax=Methylobacter sp. TaxID=2051955 RepID=UPI002586315D|nr:hypothetical protein [Methylobacter sp.]MCL7421538.1 hypothetical protein [Methylobacter sp.]
MKAKISLVIDNELKQRIDDHRAQIHDETGLNVSLNETASSLLRKALSESEGKRKLKTRRKNTPGIRINPDANILKQVRERT